MIRLGPVVALVVVAGCGAPAPVQHSGALRVMTVNLRHNKDFPDERLPLLADEIVRLAPDVVGMQEVEIGEDQGNALREAVRQKNGVDYGYDEELKSGVAGLVGEGIGIFFRGEKLARDVLDLSDARVALFDRVDFSDGLVVDLYDTHLTSGNGTDFDYDEDRRVQAATIASFIEGRDEGHTRILTGDMNSTPDAASIAAYTSAGLVDSWAAVHPDDPGPTSPVVLSHDPSTAQHFTHRIDYVFDDGSAQPTDSTICFDTPDAAGLYPTDHLGVMTTFAMSWTE